MDSKWITFVRTIWVGITNRGPTWDLGAPRLFVWVFQFGLESCLITDPLEYLTSWFYTYSSSLGHFQTLKLLVSYFLPQICHSVASVNPYSAGIDFSRQTLTSMVQTPQIYTFMMWMVNLLYSQMSYSTLSVSSESLCYRSMDIINFIFFSARIVFKHHNLTSMTSGSDV